MKVRICPNCGTHNPEDAWNCARCKRTLSMDTLVEWNGVPQGANRPPAQQVWQPAASQPRWQQEAVSRDDSSAQEIAEPAEFLLQAAAPGIYRANAFRVVELPVDSTPRDLARRHQIVEMAGKTGMPVPPGQGRVLPLAASADPAAVREAMQRLRDPEQRLVEEFFWFWPHQLGQSRGDEALAALVRGDVASASETWLHQEAYQSEANVSMHNLAILSHTAALDLEHLSLSQPLSDGQRRQRDICWQQAFERWKVLLGHEGFWSRLTARIRELDDPRLPTGTARRIRASLPLALLLINAQLAVRAAERSEDSQARRQLALMQVVSGFGEPVADQALRRAVDPIRDRIKALCRGTEADANANHRQAGEVARRFLEQVGPLLGVLDCLLPPGNSTRDAMHDEIAVRALQTQITYANETRDWATSLDILERTRPIPATESVRKRIEENIEIVKGNLEHALCFFCKQQPAQDAAAVEVKMHGNVVRMPIPGGTRVTWQQATVRVPRCSRCKSAHAEVTKRGSVAAGIGAAVGLVVGVIGLIGIVSSRTKNAGCCGLGFLVAAVAIAASIANAIGQKVGQRRLPAGIKPESAKTDFPPLKELMKQGWHVGQKPAGVQ